MQSTLVPPPWVKLEPKAGYKRYGTVWEDIYEILDLVPRLGDEEWQEIRARIREGAESEVK